MIVREILKDTENVLATFDYFNDYKDTRSWAKRNGCPHLVKLLDAGNETWMKERNKRLNLANSVKRRYKQ